MTLKDLFEKSLNERISETKMNELNDAENKLFQYAKRKEHDVVQFVRNVGPVIRTAMENNEFTFIRKNTVIEIIVKDNTKLLDDLFLNVNKEFFIDIVSPYDVHIPDELIRAQYILKEYKSLTPYVPPIFTFKQGAELLEYMNPLILDELTLEGVKDIRIKPVIGYENPESRKKLTLNEESDRIVIWVFFE